MNLSGVESWYLKKWCKIDVSLNVNSLKQLLHKRTLRTESSKKAIILRTMRHWSVLNMWPEMQMKKVVSEILTRNAGVEYLQRHGLDGCTDIHSFKKLVWLSLMKTFSLISTELPMVPIFPAYFRFLDKVRYQYLILFLFLHHLFSLSSSDL